VFLCFGDKTILILVTFCQGGAFAGFTHSGSIGFSVGVLGLCFFVSVRSLLPSSARGTLLLFTQAAVRLASLFVAPLDLLLLWDGLVTCRVLFARAPELGLCFFVSVRSQ